MPLKVGVNEPPDVPPSASVSVSLAPVVVRAGDGIELRWAKTSAAVGEMPVLNVSLVASEPMTPL